jgi:hypothetical protein
MSLSLINGLYHGCVFIDENQNYLIESFYEIDDKKQICKVYLVTAECDFKIWIGTYKEFKTKVVK